MRLQKNRARADQRSCSIIIPDNRNCNKLSSFKLAMIIIMCSSILTLFCCTHINLLAQSNSRKNIVSRWIWGTPDFRYISGADVNWQDVITVVKKISSDVVGLLNFNNSETSHWIRHFPNSTFVFLELEHASADVTWDSLYPEWIDEPQDTEIPTCPSLPKISTGSGHRLDLIAVKLPCRNERSWSRDVARLHLQLATAGLAASHKGNYAVYVLLLSDCFPTPNLFTCKELVMHEGNAWLYKPNLYAMRDKLHLPVGSCELSLPLRDEEHVYSGDDPAREAYATILHSAPAYVCGAIAVAQSIRMSGSTRDLVILVDDTINDYHRGGLEAAGWLVRTIQRIRNPRAEKDAYNEWNYSKFRLWQLTDYAKIIFVDSDLLVLRNIDFLFGLPEISATGNNATFFNSGVMVIEPSECTFELLMGNINEFDSYNGGDQGYLNEVFTWWHRIPHHMNFLKHFWVGDQDDVKEMKTRLFGAEPPVLYVLHYLGIKPWLCYRDYDCTWNVGNLREFACDTAHRRWWKLHDAMPQKLQEFCLLRTKQKAQLEWDRREAERGKYSDGHWRITIRDPRMKICIGDSCSWKSMLEHWG